MSQVEILEQKGYHFLWIDDQLFMWDVAEEFEYQREIARQAYGDVLVAGYGLGVSQRCLLENPRVTSVRTVELLRQVVDECRRVYGTIHGEIVVGDFFDYQTDRSFDCVIGDTWAEASAKHLDEYIRFKRKAQSLVKPGGKMLGWGMDYLEYLLTTRDTIKD